MAGGLIDEPKAWKSEIDPDDSSKVIQKLRVFLDTITAEFNPSGLKNAGRHSEVTVNDSSWTALPSTALSDRNAIAIQNNSTTSNVKINYVNSIGTYTGMTIRKNGGERQYDIKDTITLYAKAETGNVTLDIEELS
jgi:hypothetical protein